MGDTLVTGLQLVVLGLTFGLAGPCLLSCLPLTLGIASADVGRPGQLLRNQGLFLLGRWAAYALLGALAGASGALLQRYGLLAARPGSVRTVLGVFTLLFSLLVAWGARPRAAGSEPLCRRLDRARTGSCFVLGLCVGLAPCGPLLALLLEVALIASGPLAGLLYAGLFGAGTAAAGALLALLLAGGARSLRRFLEQPRLRRGLQLLSALALFLLGLFLIFHDLRALQR
jgi:sulfite exporter TauE/SafE